MKCCPACGQTLPPGIPKGLVLRAGHQRIYDIVRRAGPYGITSTDLCDKVYADDPNGGPLDARNTLACRIVYLNRKLKPFGQRVTCGGGRSDGAYKLVKL